MGISIHRGAVDKSKRGMASERPTKFSCGSNSVSGTTAGCAHIPLIGSDQGACAKVAERIGGKDQIRLLAELTQSHERLVVMACHSKARDGPSELEVRHGDDVGQFAARLKGRTKGRHCLRSAAECHQALSTLKM